MARVSELKSQGKEAQVSQGRRAPFKFAKRFLAKLAERSEEKRTVLSREASLPAKGRANRRAFLRTVSAAAGAALLASPLLRAEETKVAYAGDKVEYEAFSDPAELEPFFKNASEKLVRLNPEGVNTLGQFEIRVSNSDEYGVDLLVTGPMGKEYKASFASPLSEINILNLELGGHPFFRGNIVVFAVSDIIALAYNSIKGEGLAGRDLKKGGMRNGPIRTGFGMDGQTLLIMGCPETLREGDVAYQVQFDAGGNYAGAFFKYTKEVPAGTKLASL